MKTIIYNFICSICFSLTIFIPIAMLTFKIEANISIVPLLLLLFAFFYFVNNNAHKLYLSKEEKVMGEDIEKEKKFFPAG